MEQADRTNTTEGTADARRDFGQFEYGIHDLVCMSQIAATWAERLFADGGLHRRLTGKENCYHVSKEQLDNLLFLINKVASMAEGLDAEFVAVLEGRPTAH